MYTIGIKWDVDSPEEAENLPFTVEIPEDINYDDIEDWLSDTYGFCHKGFGLIEAPLWDWETETEYGEPQHWYYLTDGTSLEIVHEEYGLTPEKQYYTIRRHCSEEDFEKDTYHNTCGVIETYVFDTLSHTISFVDTLLLTRGAM